MGILDDYLDPDVIDDEPAGFEKPPDGTYEFEIGDAGIKKWEDKKGEHNSFVIDYYLTDPDEPDREVPKASDFLTLPEEDADPEDYTQQEKRNLRTLRDRFLALGFDRSQFKSIDRDDLVGLSGVLTLKTNAKGFQNILDFTADEVPEQPVEEEEKPKARATSRRAGETSRPAKPKAKAAEPEPDEDEPTFNRRSRRGTR